MKGKLYIVVFLLCLSSLSEAQSDSPGFLYLHSGVHTLPPTTEALTPTREEIFDGKFIRLIQFNTLPTLRQQFLLEQNGVELLDYLPINTYLCKLNTNVDRNLVERFNIRSIVPLTATQKWISANQDDGNSISSIYLTLVPEGMSAFNKFISRYPQAEWEVLSSGTHSVIELSLSPQLLDRLLAAPFTLFAEAVNEEATPEDAKANGVHGIHPFTLMASDLHLSGKNVRVAIGDVDFDPTHIDFAERTLLNQTLQSGNSTHAEMVAGILAGAGNLNPAHRGVAPEALLYFLNSFQVINDASSLAEEGVVITSTSYGDGCNRGYTTFTQLADRQAQDYPQLIHVFSVGNSGVQDCGYGAGPGWGNITGGIKTGKNVLTVGNVDFARQIIPSSSRGPTPDGRLKPDLCAIGDGQVSTSSNQLYQSASGSSAAAPNVAGALALMYEAYRLGHNDQNPPSALMKPLLLNTAIDLGVPGPDFVYGFGQMNVYAAVQALEQEQYFEGTTITNSQQFYSIEVPEGVHQFKVMLYWADYPGSPISSIALVNDLDLRATDPDGMIHFPKFAQASLNSNELNDPVKQGVDRINNVEQICITKPKAGYHTISVQGFSVPKGPQTFYLTYQFEREQLTLTHPYSNDCLLPGEETTIFWQAPASLHTFELEYQHNGNWYPIGTAEASSRHFDWLVPAHLSGIVQVRIKRDDQSDVSTNISAIGTPQALHVTQVCPGYVALEWDAIDGADYYTIFQLKGGRMDSIQSVNNQTNTQIAIQNPINEQWFAIQSGSLSGAKSCRSIAISNGVGLMSCQPDHDLTIRGISAPQSTYIPTCFSDSIPLIVNVTNQGTQMQSGFKIHYQIDGGSISSAIYSNPIPPLA